MSNDEVSVEVMLRTLVGQGLSVDFRAAGSNLLVRLTDCSGERVLIGEAHVSGPGGLRGALVQAQQRLAPLPLDMSPQAVADRALGAAIAATYTKAKRGGGA